MAGVGGEQRGRRDTRCTPPGKHFQRLRADQTQRGESPQLPVCGAPGHRSRPASAAAAAAAAVAAARWCVDTRPCA